MYDLPFYLIMYFTPDRYASLHLGDDSDRGCSDTACKRR